MSTTIPLSLKNSASFLAAFNLSSASSSQGSENSISLESCALLPFSKFSTAFHKTERSANFSGAYSGKRISEYIFVPLRYAAEATADCGFSPPLLIIFALRCIIFVLICIPSYSCFFYPRRKDKSANNAFRISFTASSFKAASYSLGTSSFSLRRYSKWLPHTMLR